MEMRSIHARDLQAWGLNICSMIRPHGHQSLSRLWEYRVTVFNVVGIVQTLSCGAIDFLDLSQQVLFLSQKGQATSERTLLQFLLDHGCDLNALDEKGQNVIYNNTNTSSLGRQGGGKQPQQRRTKSIPPGAGEEISSWGNEDFADLLARNGADITFPIPHGRHRDYLLQKLANWEDGNDGAMKA
ncbi:hypothetical protein CDEST_12130 [Colletotrichum destructivum]|uniref:Ankyrin repeat protein n=1 Tax=Colletotrichum destructivum TaxID=34406 RepID=A0AAX4IV86_9PEZI|nr:hypothetical protein CDEST_12130 [Colletotrichum destructivum]